MLTVQPFADDAEALHLANDLPYALAPSVWTNDQARAMRVSRNLDFECVWVNTRLPLVAEMPDGGFKHSGTARTCRSTASRSTRGSKT